MKKFYLILAVLATAMLSSCVKEQFRSELSPLGENDVAFFFGGTSTKSMDRDQMKETGVTIPMGTDGQGNKLYLQETIEELNPTPATKGAPAYTVNVGTLYPTVGVYASAGSFADEGKNDAVFEVMSSSTASPNPVSGKGWRYSHGYEFNPWPGDDTSVDFYLHMPASLNLNYSAPTDTDNGEVTFTLDSPLNGAEQQDILFGQVAMSKNQHDAQLPDGYPVTMKHALTGIKFANGHLNNNQTKTIITSVALVGLKSHGRGTVGADGVVTWDSVDTPSTEESPFYLEFENPTYTPSAGALNPDGTVSRTGDKKWVSDLNGTSWTTAAADHNLNNTNGELTFWFIPQEVPDNLELHIVFQVKTPDTPDGVDVPHTIELGRLLNEGYTGDGELKWEAGQLRTYTLKPFDADVEIKDQMTAVQKSNLHIANTGNVDEYVRMLIMGNWYGWKPGTTAEQMKNTEPSILVGYKYKDAASTPAGHNVDEMVDPWYREGYDHDGDGVYEDPYGSFDTSFSLGKLGERDGRRNDWADASGGFYYTMPIGPGAGVGEGAASATKALFESYTVSNVPTIYLPVGNTRQPAEGVHLVMEIVVQAIAVPTNEDGTPSKWWLEAWHDATGIAKLDPEADRNRKYKTFYTNGEYASNTSGSGN